LCKEENFDIERKAIDLLARKDYLRGGAPERFKSALSVVHANHREAAKDRVERLPHVASQPALVFRDAALGMLAIPKEHFHIGMRAKVLQEDIHLTKGNAEVGIHVEDDVAGGRAYPCSHRKTFSAMFLIRDHPQIRLAGRRLGGYLARPVCTGFHDDD